MKKRCSYGLLTVWIVCGVYFGIAGYLGSEALQGTSTEARSLAQSSAYYNYEGLTFATENDLRAFLQEKNFASFFPWLFQIPQIVTPLIAAVAFGLLGGCGRMLKELVLDKKPATDLRFVSCPLFGAFIGLLVYLLALILPAVFISGTRPIRPLTIAAISIAAGLFYERVYKSLEAQIKKLFPVT